jgi:RNA polymerase sigma-70 factor, ECF subfamily
MTFATLAERPKTDGDDGHEEGGLPRSLSQPMPRTEPRVIAEPPVDVGDQDVRARLDARDFRGAVAACARHYGVALGRLCFAMLGIQSEAEEATQETLLAAYDGLERYRGEGTVRSWLYGIARRLCARRLEVRTRQARRSRLIAPAMAGENDQNASTDGIVDAARRGHAVRVALEALRPTEREAVLLRFESDLSFKEVGEACGIDEAAARKRVSRALARLRERLAESR